MNDNTRVLRRYVRQVLLAEGASGAPDTSGMAAYVSRTGRSATAVVYIPSKLNLGTRDREASMPAVVGHVVVKACAQPCNGAWQVVAVAGPGKIVYGVAYALAPEGRLVPDRSGEVSDDARRAWTRVYGRRASSPLDPVSKHERGSGRAAVPHDGHTDDTADDCATVGVPELDRSYESEGWERGVLSSLEAAHEATMSKLPPGTDRGSVESTIHALGASFFGRSLKY